MKLAIRRSLLVLFQIILLLVLVMSSFPLISTEALCAERVRVALSIAKWLPDLVYEYYRLSGRHERTGRRR